MAGGVLEELSPLTVGSERIALRAADPLTAPRALTPVDVDVDLSLCEPEGVVLPLELVFTSPTKTTRRLFRTTVPSQLSVLPQEGGRHIVTLREVAHNKWWGRHVFEAEGDDLKSRRA